jgi:hypothetical protein
MLASNDGHPHLHAFYEWINPIIDQGSGAYPFRTGTRAKRIATADISKRLKENLLPVILCSRAKKTHYCLYECLHY